MSDIIENSAGEPGQDKKGITATFFAYHKEVITRISGLIQRSGIKEVLDISAANLAKRDGIRCDMAIAILGRHEDVQIYKHDVAFLKLVRKVPVVVALIGEGAQKPSKPAEAVALDDVLEVITEPAAAVEQESIDTHLAELAADEIIRMPVDPDEFSKTIKTHIASIKIEQSKDISLAGRAARQKPLGEILVEANLITPLQLKKALDYQKGMNIRLGDALVELGFIDEEQKIKFLAKQLGVPSTTPKQFVSLDITIVGLIPEHIARQNKCIALAREAGILTVAMADVLNLRLLDNLRDITEMTVRPVLGPPQAIGNAIDRYYKDVNSQRNASSLLDDLKGDVEVVHQKEESIDIEKATAEGVELGIIKLVNMLVANAIRDRASDIHIEPMEKDLLVRYRIDGDLRKAMSPPRHSHQAIITRIKILSDLDIAERRLPQDGRMAVRVGDREVDIRVSILPTVWGEKAVLRILDKEAFNKSIVNLGFTPHDQAIFKTQIAKPYGIIIVTGPTGSGKSTTLYAALQEIKSITDNIITVEDPVEFHIENITQVAVNNKIGLTFGAALRSILRQDPDIILIGEIRDDETADIAVKMSLTGHLVFSTLHTNDAASSIARLVDIGVPPLLLGSSLNLIIAQRLVRRLCKKCKVEYTAPPELLEQLGLQDRVGLKFFRGEGCVACNGAGYSGRVGIFEMLEVTRELRTLVVKNAPTQQIQDLAMREGMKTLRQSGIELALAGETAIEQVIAATTEI